MPISQDKMETVAEAAEKIGYSGTDASAVISLAEYGFLARTSTPYVDGDPDTWDVLFHVQENQLLDAGFIFATVDAEENDLFDVSEELHELRQNLRHKSHSAERTLKLLRKYHDPEAEAKASEARAILRAKANAMRAHISGHISPRPHITDVVVIAEYAAEHQDPRVVLEDEKGSGSERRERTVRKLQDLIKRKWRSVGFDYGGPYSPDEPKHSWTYSF